VKPRMNEAEGLASTVRNEAICDLRLPWFALQVRSRHEAYVADCLQGKGYEWFLPQYKCRKRWSDRIREVETPLFPGYLFCRFDPQNRLPILKTPGVMQIMGCHRSPLPVDDSEISAIQTLVASGIPNGPWPFLHTGDAVQIQCGPLRGLQGILVGFKGNYRLILSVTLLQRSVAVEIDSGLVTSVRPAAKAQPENANLRLRPAQLAV